MAGDPGETVDILDDEELAAAKPLWVPGPDVKRHNGEPLPEVMVFFAPPPDEIGEVLTAESTLKPGRRPMPTLSRLAVIGFAGSAAWVGLSLLGLEPIWQVLAAIVAAGVVWLATRFRHHVGYVGSRGTCRITCSGAPTRISKTDVFRFEDAAELRTGQTRMYHNGVYTGTSYHFTWTDASGKQRYRLNGTYHGLKKPPKAKDKYHFATSAEQAWSVFLLERADAMLQEQGALVFRLGTNEAIAVGPGFVEIRRKDETERWPREEIGAVQMSDGAIKIKRVDAKEGWFSKQGVFQFPYERVPNARLFFLALDRLVGFRWG
jgi:hypothetical protein